MSSYKSVVASSLLALGIGFYAGYEYKENNPKSLPPVIFEEEKPKLEYIAEKYSVERVVDGDTIVLKEGVNVLMDKVRLLGINTPEKGHLLYEDAKSALESLVEGKSIPVERDAKKNLDKYGRILGYITSDGMNVNVEMVRKGYAIAFMHEGLKYEKEISDAQKEAKEKSLGIWAPK